MVYIINSASAFAKYLDLSNFLLEFALLCFRILSFCLIFVCLVSAAGCHCFGLDSIERAPFATFKNRSFMKIADLYLMLMIFQILSCSFCYRILKSEVFSACVFSMDRLLFDWHLLIGLLRPYKEI